VREEQAEMRHSEKTEIAMMRERYRRVMHEERREEGALHTALLS